MAARRSIKRSRGGEDLARPAHESVRVYVRDSDALSQAGAEEYLSLFGMVAWLPAGTDLSAAAKTLCFRVRLTEGPDFLRAQDYSSGFEYRCEPFSYATAPKTVRSPGFAGLLGNAQFVVGIDADAIIKDCTNVIDITFDPYDLLAPRMALSFAAYCAERGDGVLVDPASGGHLIEGVRETIAQEIKAIEESYRPDPDRLTPFGGDAC